MILGIQDSATCAAEAMVRLQSYKPYQYGGEWFVCVANGKGFAFRKLADARRKCPVGEILKLSKPKA